MLNVPDVTVWATKHYFIPFLLDFWSQILELEALGQKATEKKG
jgi:hypothetical protein